MVASEENAAAVKAEERRIERELDRLARDLARRSFHAGFPLPVCGKEFVPPGGSSRLCKILREYVKEHVNKAARIRKRGAGRVSLESLKRKTRNTWMTTERKDGVIRSVMIRIFNARVYWGRTVKVRHDRVTYATTDTEERLEMLIGTYVANGHATYVSAERKAQKKLRTLLSEEQYQRYFVSDMFLEKGKSGVSYLIRKSRPSIAFRDGDPLCCLCLHPMGYYLGTWAGALCPTDDVIAHLILIRSDEHFFWKRANHIKFDKTKAPGCALGRAAPAHFAMRIHAG